MVPSRKTRHKASLRAPDVGMFWWIDLVTLYYESRFSGVSWQFALFSWFADRHPCLNRTSLGSLV